MNCCELLPPGMSLDECEDSGYGGCRNSTREPKYECCSDSDAQE